MLFSVWKYLEYGSVYQRVINDHEIQVALNISVTDRHIQVKIQC